VAIYHLSLTPVKKAGTTIARSAHHGGHRLTTRGALGKAAYLAGERLQAHDGHTVDYGCKADDVEHSQLILPGGGTTDRERLWSAIDTHPTQRETATIARDMIVALPHELTFEQRKAAAVALGRWIADRYGVAVDLGMHKPDLQAGSNERNYHAHYLISERRVSPTGEIGLVNRELNQMVCRQRDPQRGRTEERPTAGKEIRMAWQRIANEALAHAGHQERIDMRSNAARGIAEAAGKHRGAKATREMRENERTRTAERGQPREQASASTGPTEREAGAAREARIGRTIGELRAKLAEATREMAARSKMARDRIDAIQEQRKPAPFGPAITADIGSVQGWMHDPAAQFVRAWEAADRASALRRRVRAAERARMALRAPTKEEAAELRGAGRARTRADKLCARIAKVLDQTKGLDPTERIMAPDAARSSRQLDAIERTLAGHARRAQKQHAAMEM
jgi:MobA/MobL family